MPKLICIVADKTGLRRMLSFALAMQGVLITETESMAEALEERASHQFDMFIVDLAVSESGVLDLVRRLRHTEGSAAVPVIIVSDRDDFEQRQMARRLEHVAWLRKPFRISEIQRVVASGLEQRRRMTASVVESAGAGSATPAAARREGPQT